MEVFPVHNLIVISNVIKLGPTIDSVEVLGQWVTGRISGLLVELHKSMCIKIINM